VSEKPDKSGFFVVPKLATVRLPVTAFGLLTFLERVDHLHTVSLVGQFIRRQDFQDRVAGIFSFEPDRAAFHRPGA